MLNDSARLMPALSLLPSSSLVLAGWGVEGAVTPWPHLQVQESNVPVELDEARTLVTRAAKAVVMIVNTRVRVVEMRDRIVMRRGLFL